MVNQKTRLAQESFIADDSQTGQEEVDPCCSKKKRRPKSKQLKRAVSMGCPRRKYCCTPASEYLNGYLRFLSLYRRKHCNDDPKCVIIRAARAWCRLTIAQRERYGRYKPCSQ